MAEIKVNGRIKFKTFQSEFIKSFPFLVPTLRDKTGKTLDNEYTIAKCNTIANGEYNPIKVDELSVNGNLLVGSLEKRFFDNFGIPCEVILRKNGKHQKTNDKFDKLSLTQANKLAEKEGYEKIIIKDIVSYK